MNLGKLGGGAVFCVSLLFCACDDTTGLMGIDTMPGQDAIALATANYPVEVGTVESGKCAAKTNECHLGKFTDPVTRITTTSDFMAQLYCLPNFEFPKDVKEVSGAELRLFYSSFTGDSLSASKVKVYELDNIIDNNGQYFSDINPKDYYDESKAPLAYKSYTALDKTVDEDYRNNPDSFSAHIKVVLPQRVGEDIYAKYKAHPEYFKDSYSFIKNVCKGYYCAYAGGEGTMLNVDHVRLTVNFKYWPDKTSKPDSIIDGSATFAGTEEVIQTSRVVYDNSQLAQYLNDQHTAYMRTPAGLFTQLSLPVDQLVRTDSLNTAALSLRILNDKAQTSFALSAPVNVLMVRKGEKDSFFEKNKIPDNVTSYLNATSSYAALSTNNLYEYANIRGMMLTMRDEKEKELSKMKAESKYMGWTEKQLSEEYNRLHPDWNKVLLIPVTLKTVAKQTNSGATVYEVVNVYNDFSLHSVRLKATDVQLKVIYSRIHN